MRLLLSFQLSGKCLSNFKEIQQNQCRMACNKDSIKKNKRYTDKDEKNGMDTPC